jgi:uncharacterized protein
MTHRTGRADLPLHGGHVPPWLFIRMAQLGAVIGQAIVHHYGRDEFLRRLASPFWFQSFGAVMGMDWHSSGITTSVIGALRQGLQSVGPELGLYVCGGKGKYSRQTPQQLRAIAERVSLDGEALGRTSRLVAKVDSAAVQDGFDLYLHGFILAEDGKWTIVQQGMNGEKRQARRYHWHSEGLKNFFEDPHAGIEGSAQGIIVNLADRRARASRDAQLGLLASGPDNVVREVIKIKFDQRASAQLTLPHLIMPERHDVRGSDVILRRLHGTLAAAADRGPTDFADLLLCPGIGARTVQSLAMVAEVVHGAPCRFQDPARFSLAHGGKDRHPFPVPIRVYDETIRVMKSAVQKARLGREEQLAALRRLDDEARRLEQAASGPSLEAFFADERGKSPDYHGRSVFGWETKLKKSRSI